MDILMYSLGSVFFIFALIFTYYSLQSAKLTKGSREHYLMIASAMLFIVISMIGVVDTLFFPGSGLHLSVFFVWIIALCILIYGGLLAGKAIQKVYPSSLLKIAWEYPGSIHYLIGVSVLVLGGIPAYLLDILHSTSGEFCWYSVFSIAIWGFCFANLTLGARTYCLSGVEREEEQEEVILFRDDILAIRAYGALINKFLTPTKPFSGLIRESLLEYFEYNPILFESCKFKQDGTIDFEPLVRDIGRIPGENRISAICTMFSALSSKLLELYGAVTSPKHAEELLAKSYRATREAYRDSPVFFDILRSLPKGVLEEERIVLLPREELEARVQQRTRQLHETKVELEKAKNYTDNIIKSMADALIIVDPDGTIKAVNQASLDLLGYQENELMGKSIRAIFGEDEILMFKNSEPDDNLTERGFVRNVEKTYLSKDGRKIPVLFSGSVMSGDDGKIQGIIYLARDITERKKTEKTLIRAERLRALGEMAAGVAHDFNNLLAIILGNAQL
ncbi:MAG: PAS domain S-box protein, partial [Candidatus Hydrothermarchaeota archaeon]